MTYRQVFVDSAHRTVDPKVEGPSPFVVEVLWSRPDAAELLLDGFKSQNGVQDMRSPEWNVS